MALLNFKRKNKNETNNQTCKEDNERDFEIAPDTIISDILTADEELFEVFMEAGMFCVMCPLSQSETLEEACGVHDVPVEDMVCLLNERIRVKTEKADTENHA